MPAYDSVDFWPPAPTALVTVRSRITGASVADVPMLLDTGADISLLPRESIASLIDVAQISQQYELEAFDGTRSWAPVVLLELQLLGKSFHGQFVLVDGRYGVVGRNVLNALPLLFDGPKLSWVEHR